MNEYKATTLRELGVAYINAKSNYARVIPAEGRTAFIVMNSSDTKRRGPDPKESIVDAKYRMGHGYNLNQQEEHSEQQVRFLDLVGSQKHPARSRYPALERLITRNPTRTIIHSDSFPAMNNYGTRNFRRQLAVPVWLVFEKAESLADTFDPALPICIPNPIDAPGTQIRYMVNSTDSDQTEMATLHYNRRRYQYFGEAAHLVNTPWAERVFGKEFLYLMHLSRPVNERGRPFDYTVEELDNLLDTFVRRPIPIEEYVHGLANMGLDDLQFETGVIRTENAPFAKPDVSAAAIQFPNEQDRTLVLYLAYLAALISAKRTVMMILAIVRNKDISSYFADPRDVYTNTKFGSLFQWPHNKTVDYMINSSQIVAPEEKTSMIEKGANTIRSAIASMKKHFNSMHDNSAPQNLHQDHAFDFPMPDDDAERPSPMRIEFLTTEAFISKLDNLIAVLDERLNKPLRRPLVLRVNRQQMRYMNDAVVSVWPTKEIEGIRTYIFNPYPPLVENILIPHSYFE